MQKKPQTPTPSKRPVGRPRKDSEPRRHIILQALQRGVPFTYACELARIDRETGRRWALQDADFAAEIAAYRALGVNGLVEKTIEQNGAWKILKNVARDEFKENVEIEIGPSKRLLVDLQGDGEDFKLER